MIACACGGVLEVGLVTLCVVWVLTNLVWRSTNGLLRTIVHRE